MEPQNNHLALHFNSHAHVERDTIGSACVAEFFNFNSHAHVERDSVSSSSVSFISNFNSHAHVERDHMKCRCHSQKCISTHTLTWSVTISADVKTVNNFISTHTLTWSVTATLQL